jgi:hypothetical protein
MSVNLCANICNHECKHAYKHDGIHEWTPVSKPVKNRCKHMWLWTSAQTCTCTLLGPTFICITLLNFYRQPRKMIFDIQPLFGLAWKVMKKGFELNNISLIHPRCVANANIYFKKRYILDTSFRCNDQGQRTDSTRTKMYNTWGVSLRTTARARAFEFR